MDSFEQRDTDAVIDTALSTERMRRVPSGFFGRVRQRLALVALMQQEQRRFRKYAMGVGFLLLAAAAGALLAYVASIPSRIAWYVPGGMGFIDYVKTQLALSVRMFAAVVFLGFAVPLGAALFTFVRPSGKPDAKRRDSIFW